MSLYGKRQKLYLPVSIHCESKTELKKKSKIDRIPILQLATIIHKLFETNSSFHVK